MKHWNRIKYQNKNNGNLKQKKCMKAGGSAGGLRRVKWKNNKNGKTMKK